MKKKPTIFQCAQGAYKTMSILRLFILNLRAFNVSAKGASENFREFRRRAPYDVIFFKFQEEVPLDPHPPPNAGAHDPGVTVCVTSCSDVDSCSWLMDGDHTQRPNHCKMHNFSNM